MLLERGEQLHACADYLAEAAAGSGRLVYVAGEAGIGKSTFTARVVADAGSTASVAVGACDGSATPAPLGPLVEMLPHLPDDVWPLGATRQEVFARLLATLADPPDGRPWLLVVEDAHWADEATLDLLRYLARRIHACRALVLVTYRPEDAAAVPGLRILLGDTASATGTRRIDLPPLSPDAVRRLVAEHARQHPEAAGADPAQLFGVTGGNAFFVTEALSGGAGRVPPTVRDAVLARVARLDEESQRALEVVALAGARAETGLLVDLLAHGLTAIDEPLDRGLLRLVDGDVVFRHELARLAVADEVPVGRSVHIHRRLLAALIARGADPAVLAHHAEAGGEVDAVLAFAPVAAARAAELGAHQEAVRQYRRALRHADRLTDEQRAELLWALGYESYLTLRIDEAIAATREALDLWDAAGDGVRVGDAWRCLSRLSWFAGRRDDAEQQAEAAIDLLEGTETVEQALAYSNRAQLRMLSSDLAGTQDWGRRTLDLVDRLPDGGRREEVRLHALNNLGSMEMTAGDLDAGRALLVESLEGARAADLHEHAARAYCNLVSTAVVQRRHEEAQRYLDEGMDYCIDRDLDSWTLYLEGSRARFHLHRGDSAAARELAESVLERSNMSAIDAIEPRASWRVPPSSPPVCRRCNASGRRCRPGARRPGSAATSPRTRGSPARRGPPPRRPTARGTAEPSRPGSQQMSWCRSNGWRPRSPPSAPGGGWRRQSSGSGWAVPSSRPWRSLAAARRRGSPRPPGCSTGWVPTRQRRGRGRCCGRRAGWHHARPGRHGIPAG